MVQAAVKQLTAAGYSVRVANPHTGQVSINIRGRRVQYYASTGVVFGRPELQGVRELMGLLQRIDRMYLPGHWNRAGLVKPPVGVDMLAVRDNGEAVRAHWSGKHWVHSTGPHLGEQLGGVVEFISWDEIYKNQHR